MIGIRRAYLVNHYLTGPFTIVEPDDRKIMSRNVMLRILKLQNSERVDRIVILTGLLTQKY